MKTWICVGHPDEENMYNDFHTSREEWECRAETMEEAERKAFDHFWYFHEVGVYEKE